MTGRQRVQFDCNPMTTNHFEKLDELEKSLWEAADQLRANSRQASSQYFMPVFGVIFLRHASNRYEVARREGLGI